MTKPTAIDLFSGCGGLTLGLKQAGFRVRAAVEIDPLAVETYKKNHPRVRVWQEDIQQIAPEKVMRSLRLERGQLDLLAGCPPCQGFSTIRTRNKREAVADTRNDLIFSFLEYVEAFEPKTVMMENVPGLANDERFAQLCSRLRDLGYHVNHDILNAADYGVPQRRLRLVLIAARSARIEFPAPAATCVTVRNAIAALPLPGTSGDVLHDFVERRGCYALSPSSSLTMRPSIRVANATRCSPATVSGNRS